MELKEIVSIAGIGGLKRIIKQRADGLIVSEMDGSGKKFMSNKIHMFTPLENISIYTSNDNEPLANVLWKMKNLEGEQAPVSPKASAEELKTYMAKVLPDYDRDQVFVSDIKKLIKWFSVLNELDLITDPALKSETENTASEKSDEEE
jgi:hypothetical protein